MTRNTCSYIAVPCILILIFGFFFLGMTLVTDYLAMQRGFYLTGQQDDKDLHNEFN